jgi:hypothetical protein
MGMSDLQALVNSAGGVEPLAAYLGVSPELIATALNAPDSKRTERVSAMVQENTRKLILMPSQGGFFWRVTKRRVVKDWLILARWGEAQGVTPQPPKRTSVEDPPLAVPPAPYEPSDRTLAEKDKVAATYEQREMAEYAFAVAADRAGDQQHGDATVERDGEMLRVAIPIPRSAGEQILRYEIRPDGSYRTDHDGESPSGWLPATSAKEYLFDKFMRGGFDKP